MKIGIFGAGSIGCFVGGMLAADGHDVVMLGRASMAGRLKSGMTLTRYDGLQKTVDAKEFTFTRQISDLAGCEAILVCVKGMDTQKAADDLAKVMAGRSLIVSLQNGVSNPEALRNLLPDHDVLAGMVAFNVAQIGDNRFHQGIEGEIALEDGKGALSLAAALNKAGVAAMVHRNIEAIQWGKLLLNLNNAVNALSGLPLKSQLSQSRYRTLFADCMSEALDVLKAAGIRPAKVAKLPPALIPYVLRLPDWLFTRVAASMLKMDDNARSSMAEDLEKGRSPEIDFLNGEIVRLGKKLGVPTPVNDRVIAQVKERFADAKGKRGGKEKG